MTKLTSDELAAIKVRAFNSGNMQQSVALVDRDKLLSHIDALWRAAQERAQTAEMWKELDALKAGVPGEWNETSKVLPLPPGDGVLQKKILFTCYGAATIFLGMYTDHSGVGTWAEYLSEYDRFSEIDFVPDVWMPAPAVPPKP